MKRRGFVFLFLCSFLFFNFVKSEDQYFLSFPFNFSKNILQGWFYDNGSKHQGIDYYCKVGDPIFAPADGLSMSSSQDVNSNYSYGNFVFINYQNGNASLFAHLDKVNNEIKSYPNNLRNNRNYNDWTEIKKGDYIGDCGMTGTNNSHLHFETTKGFYALDRFDSYDLYTISDYYPFNDLFNEMGKNNIWSLDYIKDEIQDLDKNEINHLQNDNQNYEIELINKNQNLIVEKNSEVEIKVKIKNFNNIINSKKLSFNVLGGLEKNKIFRHESWVTDLRSSLLNKNIEENQEEEFSFLINTPNENGDFIFEFGVVENGTWKRISEDFFKINIKVVDEFLEKKDIIKNNEESAQSGSVLDREDNLIEKIKDNITKKTKEIIKKIKNVFIGNSSSAETSDNNKNNFVVEENTIEDNFDYNFSLVFPTSTEYNTNTENIVLSGLKTKDLGKIYINSSSQEISFTSTTWEKEVLLVQGENIFNIFADYVSTTVNLIISYQKVLELPEINIENEENRIDFNWQSNNYDFFDVEFKKNYNEWQNIFSKSTSTSFSTSTEIGDIFFIKVRSRDKKDNFTDWVEENFLVEYSKDVVINEIAWMGVASNRSTYEWIEFYNNTDEDIELNNWKILIESHSGTSTTIELSGIIKSNDFFLLARNDKVFKDIEENQICNFSLHNTGAKLTLYNSLDKIIDETDQKEFWFAGEKTGKYRSNERIDSKLSGNFESNWKTNDIFHYNSESKGGVPIYGSPGQDNNKFFYIPSSYEYYYSNFWDENNTFILKKEHNPYFFYNLDIPENHKIIIESGVILIGVNDSSKITVEGEFEINGVEDDRVIITSRFDDVYNKEKLNFNSNPSPSNWRNIEVRQNGKMKVNYTDFKYAGYKDYNGTQKYDNVIKNLGGEIYLNNIKITDSSKGELSNKDAYVYNNGLLEISSSTFSNGYNFLYSETGNNVKINNSIFSDFLGNNIFYIKKNLPLSFKDNTFEDSNEYVYIVEADLTDDYNFDSNIKYLFLNLNINSSSTVNISAGCELKFNKNGKLSVFGNLNILGEENNPVKITGNDNFSAIWIAGGNLDVKYLEVSGGGYFFGGNCHPVSSAKKSYVFWLTNHASANIENVRFLNTRRPGAIIYMRDSDLSIKNSYLGWNSDYYKLSSWYDNGIKLFNSNLFLDNVDFEKIDTVIDNNNLSSTTYQNMEKDNFSNMYCVSRKHLWLPHGLFNFNPCVDEVAKTIIENETVLKESEVEELEDTEEINESG